MLETLIKLGLSDKEAKVYLAALKLGTGTAAKIAQAASLNRPTTYVILEKLSKMGLISTHNAQKIQLFNAEDPERLSDLLQERKKLIESQEQALTAHLRDIRSMYRSGERPRVVVYDSDDAADAYFYAKLAPKETIYSFTDFDSLSQNAVTSASSTRLKNEHELFVIYTRREGPIADATDVNQLRQARFIPYAEFPFQSVITFGCDSGILIIHDEETKTNIMIENSSLVKSLLAVFNLIWK